MTILPCMNLQDLRNWPRISFESLLKFLGRLYSDDPQKSLPFEKVFDVLGVRLSVRQLGKTGHSLMKKPARLQKLSQLLTAISAKGRITKDEAQVVCGVLNFAMNFCMGHALKVAMRAFAAISVKPTDVMPSELAKLCSWTSDVIARLEPRTIPRAVELSPVLVFTDAAFEDQVASWGGCCGRQNFRGPPGCRRNRSRRAGESMARFWHRAGHNSSTSVCSPLGPQGVSNKFP